MKNDIKCNSPIINNVIKSSPGDRLRFLFPDNGYEIERERVKSLLLPGNVYVIKNINVDRNYTSISLDGVEGSFNSCHFVREDDYLKSQKKNRKGKRTKSRFDKTVNFEDLNLYDHFIYDSCSDRTRVAYILLMKIKSCDDSSNNEVNARDSDGNIYFFFHDDEVIRIVP